ncbi:ABC transporter permease [Phototrophicus methaneseepsis]|uniref:ABC transporter permease n=1 Tax=Phototrophicus methaneseepsis TaxID=2710758 RepID=A0A7S8EBW4_9CHLR|nr:ABC transporter permease [Phototrophicus methaneseepsis]QPC84092.1 ABC transporter permease [Phototrophicus methaneseepsis]
MTTKFQRYLLNKFFWFLIAFFVALILNFLLPRLIPGNPVDVIVGQMGAGGGISGESLQKIYASYIEEFGLDKPFGEQFLIYLNRLAHGDLGVSFALSPRRVQSLIGEALPWTVLLQLPAILIGWIVGNLLGALTAYKKGWFDRALFPSFLFVSSMPYYCLSIILLYVFAVHWQIFPAGGGYSYSMSPNLSWSFISSALEHYWLPFLSLVIVFIGGQAIGMRAMSIYELDADYVRFSRSLGVDDNRVIGYIFRNAMLPQITGLALSIGSLVSGALITEIVFGYPGIGSLLFSSIRQSDYPVVQGITLLIMIAVLVANFLVDIAYGFIDPRIRAKATGDR